MAHVFFQEFGINPGIDENQISPGQAKYLKNCLVLEIANNWPFVRWMMDRFRNEELKQVDPLEEAWFNFIFSNHIDIEKYEKNSDQFINEYLEKTNVSSD
jgi:hypothetical protein